MACSLGLRLPLVPTTYHPHTHPQTPLCQVRFLFEAFRKLRPGVPLRALHGKMNQLKRMGGELLRASLLGAGY